ncbi:hypothetical protein [Massilia consociata]|uniref:Uncharacterized protein n=1 Tax=Massilia consociata TaxID=760117 RepID=A0ABV6FF88_9BURK
MEDRVLVENDEYKGSRTRQRPSALPGAALQTAFALIAIRAKNICMTARLAAFLLPAPCSLSGSTNTAEQIAVSLSLSRM